MEAGQSAGGSKAIVGEGRSTKSGGGGKVGEEEEW